MRTVSVPISELGRLFPQELTRLYRPDELKHVAVRQGVVDSEIVNRIAEYSRGLGAPQKVLRAVDAMRNPFLAVITGQQPSLGGGPAYILWKALTAVRVAESISEQTGVRAIPVFWNHSDDSNTEPLLKFAFTRKGKVNAISFPGREAVPAFRVDLTDEETAQTRNFIASGFGGGAIADAALETLDRNLATSFTKFLFRFVGQYGIVVVEPRIIHTSRVDDILNKALEKFSDVARALEAGAADFVKMGCEPPLKFEGDRGVWAITSKRRVRAENSGGEKVERLCPGVFLRPVVQDSIFPTAAYVAGPHEFLYHKMIKRVYEVFKVVQPVVVPRMGATFITTDARRAVEDMGATPAEILRMFGSTGSVSAALPTDKSIEEFRNAVAAFAERLLRESNEGKYGKQMAEFVRRFANEISVLKERFLRKMQKASIATNEIAVRRLSVALNELLPNNDLQERTVSWLQFLNTYGESGLEAAATHAMPSLSHEIFG